MKSTEAEERSSGGRQAESPEEGGRGNGETDFLDTFFFMLYPVLYLLGLCLFLPSQLLKRPGGKRAEWFSEKLGSFTSVSGRGGESGGGPCIWVHAVSVGETLASVPFILALKERWPGARLIVSTITDTGREVAIKRLGELATVVYLPFDFGFAVDRAVERLRPDVFIAVETEIWPNLFRVMKKRGVFLAMVNGRISAKSEKGYRRLRPFLGRVLGRLDLVCVQDEVYAGRMKEIGGPAERIEVTGNFKFDIERSREELPWGEVFDGLVIMAGSTHPGEEELILSVYGRLLEKHPDLNLVLVPRHPERFDEVAALVEGAGFGLLRRSVFSGGERLSGGVFLLDTIGELFSAYRVADIAVMGGSFIGRRGGQNPLEPACWGVPVICGPHMENFPFVGEFYGAGAAVEVPEGKEGELERKLEELLESDEKRSVMGRRALKLYKSKAGAVKRTLAELEKRIDGFI